MAGRFRNFLGGVGAKLLSLSGYEAANPSRARSWLPGGHPRDAKEELTSYTRRELMRKNRYLIKNSGFSRENSADMDMYSVGAGIVVQACTADPDWNEKAEEVFRRFAHRPEITGRFSLPECQTLVCRAIDSDGEVFAVKVRDRLSRPRIQLIESHRCQDDGEADTIDGIKFDAFGAPAFYMIRTGESGDFRKIPASAVMHIFEPEDISGARSAPPLQHAINHLQDVSELLALEKGAVKSISDIAHILKRQSGEIEESNDFEVVNADDEEGEAGTDPEYIKEITGRKTVALHTDESLESFESKRPSPTFTGFLEYLDREAAGGGLPYEFTRDPSKVGGASVRLITAKAQRRFERRQQAIIGRFLGPLWVYVIGDAIDRGELAPQRDWFKSVCVTPRKITVDAGRESKENRADVQSGLKSVDDHFGELGKDAGEQLRRNAKNARRILDLAAEYGVPPEMIFSFGNKPPSGADETPPKTRTEGEEEQ